MGEGIQKARKQDGKRRFFEPRCIELERIEAFALRAAKFGCSVMTRDGDLSTANAASR
jgi:hypothetical protein